MKRLSSISRRMALRFVACAGVLVLTAVAAGIPSAANAAVSMGIPKGTVIMSITGARAGASGIRCDMVFQGLNEGLPHNSGHVPGSINVRVRVTCSAPVTKIIGVVGLFQLSGTSKVLNKRLVSYSSGGRAAANGNSALTCKPGYYEGDSAAAVTFPPGYAPHTALMRGYTAVVHIAKC